MILSSIFVKYLSKQIHASNYRKQKKIIEVLIIKLQKPNINTHYKNGHNILDMYGDLKNVYISAIYTPLAMAQPKSLKIASRLAKIILEK